MKFRTRRRNLTILKFFKRFWFALVLAIITSFWGLTFVVIRTWKAPNEIGDSFGMVNALFSGLAFAFLIYTSWMQKNELELQRKELKLSRKEMSQATEAHQKHVELLQLQIDKESNRILAKSRPHLNIEYEKKSEQNKNEFTFNLTTPSNDCVLNYIEIFDKSSLRKIIRYDLPIKSKLNGNFQNLITVRITDSSPVVTEDEFGIIVEIPTILIFNYTDIVGNKYSSEFSFIHYDDGSIDFMKRGEVEKLVDFRNYL